MVLATTTRGVELPGGLLGFLVYFVRTKLTGHVFRVGLLGFRLLRPPLLVPWTALQVKRERRILWWRRFTLRTSADVDSVLSGKAYDLLRPFLAGR